MASKPKRVAWQLPPDEPEKSEGSTKRTMRTGEPVWMELTKWPRDTYLRASQVVACCGCDLQHVETYEVFRGENTGKWWLLNRCYVIPGTGTKKPKTKRRGRG